MENPSNIIRSWGLQQNFQSVDGSVNKLAPPPYRSIKSLFVQTWREDQLSTALDWDSKQFSILLPESLRVISAAYLKIDLPASIAYKAFPGMYVVKNIRVLSAGQECYNVNIADMLSDYCSSLSNEEAKTFANCYLGGTTQSTGARSVYIPFPTPNSAYMNRNGHDVAGHGILPCFTGNTRLELQVTLNPATFVAHDSAAAPGSIAGECSVMYHEVMMTQTDLERYSDLRGNYNIITRRLQDLSSGWQTYATANQEKSVILSSPQGVVTQLILVAVPTDDNDHRLSAKDFVKATSIKVVADSICQLNLDTADKCKIHLWTNGFVENDHFPNASRIAFAAHAGEDASHTYRGGYKMTLASNVVLSFSFAEAVKYRIIAAQLQRVTCDNRGVFHATLE